MMRLFLPRKDNAFDRRVFSNRWQRDSVLTLPMIANM